MKLNVIFERTENELNIVYTKKLFDDKHVNIQMLSYGSNKTRLFADWVMRDDPIKSWVWTGEDEGNGILHSLAQSDALKIFFTIKGNR